MIASLPNVTMIHDIVVTKHIRPITEFYRINHGQIFLEVAVSHVSMPSKLNNLETPDHDAQKTHARSHPAVEITELGHLVP